MSVTIPNVPRSTCLISSQTLRFEMSDAFDGEVIDPQSLHKYAYVHGDPVDGIDPTGRAKFTMKTMVKIGIGLGFAAAASYALTKFFKSRDSSTTGSLAPVDTAVTTTQSIAVARSRIAVSANDREEYSFSTWWDSLLDPNIRRFADRDKCLQKGCIGVVGTQIGKWPVDMLDTSTQNSMGGSTLIHYSYDPANAQNMLADAASLLGRYKSPRVFVLAFPTPDNWDLSALDANDPSFNGTRLTNLPAGNLRITTRAFDSAVLDPSGFSWWGANFGQADGGARGTTKIYQWKDLDSFLRGYSNMDEVVLGVTEQGPGTLTYPYRGIPVDVGNFIGN